jgi:hypothetical protein
MWQAHAQAQAQQPQELMAQSMPLPSVLQQQFAAQFGTSPTAVGGRNLLSAMAARQQQQQQQQHHHHHQQQQQQSAMHHLCQQQCPPFVRLYLCDAWSLQQTRSSLTRPLRDSSSQAAF